MANETDSDPAEARKRRKAIIESQRQEDEDEEEPPKKRKQSGKKKTQIRYDPDVPMEKDQLASWRREQRKVRNRESAAASRQRIRNRINELELEVEDWKTKYETAMQRLEQLNSATDV